MGRTKGKHLKVLAKELVKKYRSRFSGSFEENKRVLSEAKLLAGSKEERNKLAGELTNLVKRQMKVEKADEARQAKIAVVATTQTA